MQTARGGCNAVFGSDGALAGVPAKEVAEAGFGLTIAIHRSGIEVSNTCVKCRLQHAERIGVAKGAHDAGAAEAEAGGGAAGIGEGDGVQGGLLVR